MGNTGHLYIINEIDELIKGYEDLQQVDCRRVVDKVIELVNANTELTLKGKEVIQLHLEANKIEVRICSECEKLMVSGCIISNGYAYYCSDECLNKNISSKEEYKELFEENSNENYWTDWE